MNAEESRVSIFICLDINNKNDLKMYNFLNSKSCKSKFIKNLIWNRMGETIGSYYQTNYEVNPKKNDSNKKLINITLQLNKPHEKKIHEYIKDKDNQNKFIKRLIMESMNNDERNK